MTFQDYASNHKISARAFYGIHRYRITEYTPSRHISLCGSIGKQTKMEIEQLQQDYIKTFDVAYQQVIESIRNRKEVQS